MVTFFSETSGTYPQLCSELHYRSLLRDSTKPEQLVSKISVVFVSSPLDCGYLSQYNDYTGGGFRMMPGERDFSLLKNSRATSGAHPTVGDEIARARG
jgi:hypothetical protein